MEIRIPLPHRNMRLPLLRTREQFEYWLFDMDDALEYFLASLPEEVRAQLDYSLDSLDVLEKWLLERYSTTETILNRYEHTRWDDISRYVGETFRKTLGGQWDIHLDDPHYAFFELPVLQGSNDHIFELCPLTLISATSARRTGKYLRTVLENTVKSGKSIRK